MYICIYMYTPMHAYVYICIYIYIYIHWLSGAYVGSQVIMRMLESPSPKGKSEKRDPKRRLSLSD